MGHSWRAARSFKERARREASCSHRFAANGFEAYDIAKHWEHEFSIVRHAAPERAEIFRRAALGAYEGSADALRSGTCLFELHFRRIGANFICWDKRDSQRGSSYRQTLH